MAALIIVPYRDPGDGSRSEHLRLLLEALDAGGFKNDRLIVEQPLGRKFNRGLLLNVGILEAERLGYSSVILHDVDLLPSASMANFYGYKFFKAVHLGRLWTSKYSTGGFYVLGQKTFLGGVLACTIAMLRTCNGFPNGCWGWGGEDDVLRNRLLTACGPGSISCPPAIGHYTELVHDHQGLSPDTKNMTRWEDIERYSSDLSDGLSTVGLVARWPEVPTRGRTMTACIDLL